MSISSISLDFGSDFDDEERAPFETPVCGVCGSEATQSTSYGFVSLEAHDSAPPGVIFRGCCIDMSDWSARCLSCGSIEGYVGESEDEWPVRARGKRELAVGVRALSRRMRTDPALAEMPVLSPLGVWLGIAAGTRNATGEDREKLEALLGSTAMRDQLDGRFRYVGMDAERARELADELLACPHPVVSTTVEAWTRSPLPSGARSSVRDGANRDAEGSGIPTKRELDDWVREHTRGIIDEFPADVDECTLVLLASALTATPQWVRGMAARAGKLEMNAGLQAVVWTQAAGWVAVAKPFSRDGVDVISVIADPEVSPEKVWEAADEVVVTIDEASIKPGAFMDPQDWRPPAGAWWAGGPDQRAPRRGHAWRVRKVKREMTRSEYDPTRGPRARTLDDSWQEDWEFEGEWTSSLPAWRAELNAALSSVLPPRDFAATFGGPVDVSDIPVAGLAGHSHREDSDWPAGIQCVQSMAAHYRSGGFESVAVTAVEHRSGPSSEPTETYLTEIDRVRLNFDRPHAVIAVARGGPWEGVRIFDAWVTPEMWTDPSGD